MRQVKLIAEPWDVGEGGYQVGNFPPLWSEWNGKYRDAVRDYWRGADQTLARVRLPPDRQLRPLRPTGRRPYASINFVTAHDGFTLRDLVSYNDKHNEANGEDNRDGDERQPVVELRRRGPDRRSRRRSRCARASSATSWPPCSCRRACRCCSAATRSAARSAATTTPTARTTRSRWFDWETPMTSRCSQFVARADRACRREHPVFRRRRWF